jgi:hypothetical protein
MTTEQMGKKRGTKKSAHVRWCERNEGPLSICCSGLSYCSLAVYTVLVVTIKTVNKKRVCVCEGGGRERWSELYSHLTRRIFLCERFPLHFISFFRQKRNRLKIFPQYFVRGLGIMGEERKKNPRMISTPRLFLFPYAINFKWCMPWLRQGRAGGGVCVWSVILSDRDDGERKTRKRSIKAISSPVRLGREWSISCWLAIPAQGSTSNRFQLLLLLWWLLLLRDGYISFSLASILWWLSLLLLRR